MSRGLLETLCGMCPVPRFNLLSFNIASRVKLSRSSTCLPPFTSLPSTLWEIMQPFPT